MSHRWSWGDLFFFIKRITIESVFQFLCPFFFLKAGQYHIHAACIENFLRGSPLRVYQLLSSSYVGFSSFMWVQANFTPTEALSHFIASNYKLNISLQIFFPHSVLKILSYACCAASLDRLSSIIFTRKSASTSI